MERQQNTSTDNSSATPHSLGSHKPRVLVTILGGVAYTYATKDVDVLIVDFDNLPDADIPPEYQSLPEKLS